MTKTFSEYHSQSSEISITELLMSSAEQDASERIMTETLTECHS